MKIVCLSDSFKGSLSSMKIGELVDIAAKKVWPDSHTDILCTADGGEGTVDAVLASVPGHREYCQVSDPLGRPIQACYGVLSDGTVIMEMAAAAGLTLIAEHEQNPLYTSTLGVGEMFLDALNKGYRQFYIGIGGSATNDCGMGFLKALGVKFLKSENSEELPGTGEAMGLVDTIDFSELDPRLRDCRITVLCDVENPLLGPNGAVYTFAAQKGGVDILEQLEGNTAHFAEIVKKYISVDETNAGCGAAGGLGFGLLEILKAQKQRGILAILDLINAEKYIAQADLIVTGEGRIDWQSAQGKTIWGVARICRKYPKPVIALTGCTGKNAECIYREGITSIVPILQEAVPLDKAIKKAEEYYLAAAEQSFRLIELGRQI